MEALLTKSIQSKFLEKNAKAKFVCVNHAPQTKKIMYAFAFFHYRL
jgi:hypothetical protein